MVTLIEYSTCTENSEILFYRVNGGNANQDINANSEIWNFFKRNPLPNPITSVESIDISPKTFQLQQSYPNPFNPTTTTECSLPQSDFVTLKVFNLLGEEVATLLEAHKPAGRHTISFEASAHTSGLYYYTLTADDFKQSRKMLLMR